jgi:hypothetical protein
MALGNKTAESMRRYKAAITDRLEKTSDLSAQLLRKRIRAMEIRSQQNELILAKAREELILKDLAEKQAAYLVVCMRQRMLQIPHTWARRIVGLEDVREASRILREMVVSTLIELVGLPAKVTDPNWLDVVEEEGDRNIRAKKYN